jgi:long-subunit fatty acid transport protein
LALGVGPVEYLLKNGMAIMAGIKYISPSSDKKYLYPGSSETDLWTWTLGLAYPINKTVELNFSGLYNYGSEEYDSHKYRADHYFLTLGIRIRY